MDDFWVQIPIFPPPGMDERESNELKARMSEDRRIRATKVEIKARIAYIRELYREGRQDEIPNLPRRWGVTRSQVHRYCQAALLQHDETAGRDRREKQVIHAERLDHIYQRLIAAEDYKAAGTIVRNSAELLGLLREVTELAHRREAEVEEEERRDETRRIVAQIPEEIRIKLGIELVNTRTKPDE